MNLEFLTQVISRSPEELALDEMKHIHAELEAFADLVKKGKELLEKAMHLKFDEKVEHALEEDGRLSGRVHLEEGVMAEKPKKVIWDQEKLWEIMDCLTEEERAKFIKTAHTVEERKFASWDESIRDLFIPARTVEFGKIKYQFD